LDKNSTCHLELLFDCCLVSLSSASNWAVKRQACLPYLKLSNSHRFLHTKHHGSYSLQELLLAPAPDGLPVPEITATD